MTPLEQLNAALQQADAEQPNLKNINTNATAFALLELTLAKAGGDWYFIGKSTGNAMDGAGVRPEWFQTKAVPCVRPDGQTQVVTIDALSQDAAWHLPTHQQFKVIANSAANEPGDWTHGPARLDPYLIDPVNYRWHNPPIAQPAGTVHPPAPVPPPPPAPALKPRQQFYDELRVINRFYEAPEGLQRPGGMVIVPAGTRIVSADVEALGSWGMDLMLGATPEECIAKIRQSDEWRTKHPNG